MKLNAILIRIVLLALVAFLFYQAGVWQGQRAVIQANGLMPPETAILYLKAARDSHLYWAEHEEEALWVIIPGQDARWAEEYQQMIDMLEAWSK